jgi:hypothetical protein
MPVAASLIIFFAGVARIFLVLNIPIRILSDDVHGDGAFFGLAMNIASRKWFDEFIPPIVLKEPGYPIFLAMTNFSGLPLSATHAKMRKAENEFDTLLCSQIAVDHWQFMRHANRSAKLKGNFTTDERYCQEQRL